ncbi:glycosyltransferase [Oryzihumus leptocrescens]|uniref:Galactofuranosylgalactofuranosylrhamnosyl-N-acetylglucosaminyl-diphospho-decaprenol beta-1,5/1,6-galactofuranosyltransferase n=1 Tax=Oryzihumus leptocrescens TaxID=297536 RepID=A0A542ZGD4_9MICO|nr:glycosyltransferase [Oryzihumus leptocrescens]TQL59359.1 galactofuranosylgalactofuranosylrhamnosyl-N-acetylglucosaminyl-diphospho-decaprenol beta-1,5/1,6-galactofuranosyltransferase [Oryzihumus leptocrescens]
MSAADHRDPVWREVARVVLPHEADPEALPLYVDFTDDLTAIAAVAAEEEARWTRGAEMPGTAVSTGGPAAVHGEYVLSRRSFRVLATQRVSFASYFNAFPASYWRRWSIATAVRLDLTLAGAGTVLVYRSNARGIRQVVHTERVGGGQSALSLELPLSPFGDGGWYWFDLVAGNQDLELVQGAWSVAVPADLAGRPERAPGTASLAITTFNRESFCIDTLRTLAADPDVRELIDTIYVADQGTSRLSAHPDLAEVAEQLGDQLEVIEQDNLGGSGGFSRGMLETLRAGRSRYVLVLDDDVNVETEGIRRSLAFADLARVPTIVGGHMFNMYDRPTLHAFGEQVRMHDFTWGPIDRRPPVNFALSGLRSRPWLHRRMDVNYNGWWMSLIPTAVLAEVGLSIPAFLKWDDAEFGLRAGEAGHPTVSMPGVAVWHVPWTDKDDSVDWQAYFHQRNRLVTALLHGPAVAPKRLVADSVGIDLMHASAMQYYAASLRLRALEDVLSGPGHLHPSLRTAAPQARSLSSQFSDSRIEPDPDAFPPPRGLGYTPLPMVGKRPGVKKLVPWLVTTAVRQTLLKPRPGASEAPQAYVAKMDANWWRLAQVDSAVVSTADGAGASWHRRDRDTFRTLMARSARLHRELAREWPRLAGEYRAARAELTSPEAWEKTFSVDEPSVDGRR